MEATFKYLQIDRRFLQIFWNNDIKPMDIPLLSANILEMLLPVEGPRVRLYDHCWKIFETLMPEGAFDSTVSQVSDLTFIRYPKARPRKTTVANIRFNSEGGKSSSLKRSNSDQLPLKKHRWVWKLCELFSFRWAYAKTKLNDELEVHVRLFQRRVWHHSCG